MNILYIFQDEYPWDIRVEKVVSSLSKAHRVSILCRNRGRLEPREEIEGVRIFRVGGRGLKSFIGFPAFFSPWWIGAGLSIIRRERIHLMVVRDLPLSPLSLFLRKLTGVSVIFDMAEDYPAMIRAFWKYRRPKPLDYLVRNPALLSALERFVLPRVDETWVVSEASCARIKPRTRGPVRVVRNTPNVDILEIEPHEPKTSERLRVVYTGWVDEDRGLNTVLRAVTLGKETGFEITFNIVGTGSMVPQLQELARSLKVEDAINFLGWQSQAQLRATIMENDVGVVPHHVTAHTSTTLPNKIYDYMALARPVVVSNAPALEQLVEYANCGLVFRDQDPSSLLASLRQLRSLDTRREMGANGRRQVSESMNWGVDETVIIGAVEKYDRCGL